MYQRYTSNISIFNFLKSTKDFPMINIGLDSNTKSQCWSIAPVLYRTLENIFAIYCLLTLTCFCITPFGTCSSQCIRLYILCGCLYFCLYLLTIHIGFASLQYSALQYSFGTIFLCIFFCLEFCVSHHFEFLFQSFWNLFKIEC